MIEVPRAKTNNMDEPGPCWQGGQRLGMPRTALMKCPQGHIASLSGHEIATDGTVTPSVVCPEPGCGFHDYVKLLIWSPE